MYQPSSFFNFCNTILLLMLLAFYQLAVRSRVAPDPFSEWSLLHYYSHDSNGERLTQYIYLSSQHNRRVS